MKKGLPKFVLLHDPYGRKDMDQRVVIFRTQYPRFIYELNRPDAEEAHHVQVGGKDYTVVVRNNLNDYPEIKPSYLKEVVGWYHYSRPENAIHRK